MGHCLSSLYHSLRYYSLTATSDESEEPQRIDDSNALASLTPGNQIMESVRNNAIRISEDMSQPTIRILNDDDDTPNSVSGHGLAISNEAIEQDFSYWEWHITNKSTSDDNAEECKIGLSTARNSKFYDILQGDGNASSLILATKLMRPVSNLSNGDVIGVYFDFKSTKKSVLLYHNGEKVDDFTLSRFRGNLYPAIWLPPPDGTFSARLINQESRFQHYTIQKADGKSDYTPLYNECSTGPDSIV